MFSTSSMLKLFESPKEILFAPPLSSHGKSDVAASGSPSPSPRAASETNRLQGVHRLRDRMMASRELPRLANLRDGSLMPPEKANYSPLYAWIALLVAGMAFWTWALPKVVRAVADSIVIGANGYY